MIFKMRKPICFGTKEFSKKSGICKRCLFYVQCENVVFKEPKKISKNITERSKINYRGISKNDTYNKSC